ncbi:MAG TPA: hypothetical protein VNM14_12530 [Planctomycetota bacterium]|jgi:hypothetical protein|nr:hypothetical protein [Planctomycetota bacterium]
MKFFLMVLGILLSVYAVAQFLQLLGIIGAKGGGGLAGFGITLLSGACAALCFKKAIDRGRST